MLKEEKTYHSNKNLMEHYFVNEKNEMHGFYIFYTFNNFVRTKCAYKNNTYHNVYVTFNRNRNIYFMDTSKQDIKHGVDIEFFYRK